MNERALGILQIVTAIGIILFWAGFFTVGMAPENPPACYFAYEHSFPLPDAVLCLGMLIAGSRLLKGSPLGRTLSLACAGGLLFLGLVDFGFNLQNGIYAISTLDLVLNGFINAWCVFLGGMIIARLK